MEARPSPVRRFSPTAAGCIPDMTSQRLSLALMFALVGGVCDSNGQIDPRKAVLHLDFSNTNENLRFQDGLKTTRERFGAALEFTTPLQVAEVDFAALLHNTKAATVGGWFLPR